MPVNSKDVTCPACHTRLTVRNSHNQASRRIKCIKCGQTIEVDFTAPTAPAPKSGDTVFVGANLDTGSTIIRPIARSIGWLECNGQRYNLKEGTNVVGRKASTSRADVQLSISDMYVSREHLLIRVHNSASGLVVTATNYKNKNNTWLNGTVLAAGEVINLVNGTTIKMGETIVTYRNQ